MSCMRPPPMPISVWHQLSGADLIVAGRMDWIPERLWTVEAPIASVDGHWGPHEIRLLPQILDSRSAYLAWMTLPAVSSTAFEINAIMDFAMGDKYLTPNAQLPHLSRLQKDTWKLFKDEVNYICSQVNDILHSISDDPYYSHIQFPVEVLRRMDRIIEYPNLPDIYYRNRLEAVAALQRHTSELQGFAVWH